jgi:hypothetical protein
MDEIPWKESATLSRRVSGRDGTNTEIVMEGPLTAVVRAVDAMPADDRRGLRIALPDRRVRPFLFEDASLAALLNRQRPR